jgi:hypothetical protein
VQPRGRQHPPGTRARSLFPIPGFPPFPLFRASNRAREGGKAVCHAREAGRSDSSSQAVARGSQPAFPWILTGARPSRRPTLSVFRPAPGGWPWPEESRPSSPIFGLDRPQPVALPPSRDRKRGMGSFGFGSSASGAGTSGTLGRALILGRRPAKAPPPVPVRPRLRKAPGTPERTQRIPGEKGLFRAYRLPAPEGVPGTPIVPNAAKGTTPTRQPRTPAAYRNSAPPPTVSRPPLPATAPRASERPRDRAGRCGRWGGGPSGPAGGGADGGPRGGHRAAGKRASAVRHPPRSG